MQILQGDIEGADEPSISKIQKSAFLFGYLQSLSEPQRRRNTQTRLVLKAEP